MPAIDDLEVKIKGSSDAVNKSLDALISKLGVLDAQLGKLDTKGIQKFASGMTMLSSSMRGLASLKLPDYNRVAKGISKFQQIDGTKLSQLSNSLTPLATSLGALNNVKADNKGINNLINSLTRLGNSNIQSIQNMDFSRLGASITQLANNMASAQSVSSNTIALTNAIAKLGATGGTIGMVAGQLQPLGQAIIQLTNTLQTAPQASVETIQFTNALGLLASAGSKTGTTASNLGALAIALKDFMAVMATAPSVNSNIIQMTQALANLASQGNKVASASRMMSSGFNGYSSSALRASKSTHNLAYAFGKFYANFWLLLRAFKGLGKAIDFASQLTEVQNVVDTTFGQMSYKMDEFAKNSIEKFGMSELSAKKYASRFQAMGTAMNISGQQIKKANDYLAEVTKKTNVDGTTQSYVGLSDSMSDVSLNLTKLTADLSSFYDVEQKDVAQDLESIFTGMTRPLRQYGLDLTEATLKEWALSQGMNANIKTMSQAEKTMLRYQYVLAHTTAAQGDFAKTADTWANQIRILKENLMKLGGTLGGAFINMLKPLVRGLNSVLKAVNSFVEKVVNALGVIFGWKLEIQDVGISEAVSDAEGLSDAMGGAADNAKKLKQQLQGFHELNVLTSDNGSGGGGGGGGGGGAGSANDAKYQISKTESLFESEIDNLYDLGKYIGDTITNSLESIDWSKVYEGAKGFGKGLAEFLNGLISPELFGALGKTIASSLNTAIYAALSFGETFDFNNFGLSIAEGINKFFTTFDFKALAKTLNVWAKGIFNTITTALKNISWKDVFLGVTEFLKEIDLGTISLIIGAWKWKHGGKELLAGSLNELFKKKISLGIGDKSVSIGTTIKLSIATAIVGFKIGNFLYDHIPSVREFSDALASWMFDGGDKLNVGKTLTLALGALTISATTAVLGTKLLSALATAFGASSVGALAGNNLLTSLSTWIGGSSALAKLSAIGLAIVAGLNLGKWIEKTFSDEIQKGLDFALGNPYDNTTSKIYDKMDEYAKAGKTWEELLHSGWFSEQTLMPYKEQYEGKKAYQEMIKRNKGKVKVDLEAKDLDTSKLTPEQKTVGMSGDLLSTKDKLREPMKHVGITADYINTKDNLSVIQKTVGITAKYTKTESALTPQQKKINSTANFTATKDSLLGRPYINSVSEFKSAKDSLRARPYINSTSKLIKYTNNLSANPILKSTANVVKTTNGLTANPVFNSTGRFTKTTNSLGYVPSINSIANLKSAKNSLSSKPLIGSAARLNTWTSNINPVIEGTLKIVRASVGAGASVAITGLRLSSYATGGFPQQGQIFMAREAGPELVGSIGGRTAVINNDQIVQAVSAGVYNAVSSAMSELNKNGSQPLIVNLDGKVVFDNTRQHANAYYQQTGRSAFVY